MNHRNSSHKRCWTYSNIKQESRLEKVMVRHQTQQKVQFQLEIFLFLSAIFPKPKPNLPLWSLASVLYHLSWLFSWLSVESYFWLWIARHFLSGTFFALLFFVKSWCKLSLDMWSCRNILDDSGLVFLATHLPPPSLVLLNFNGCVYSNMRLVIGPSGMWAPINIQMVPTIHESKE